MNTVTVCVVAGLNVALLGAVSCGDIDAGDPSSDAPLALGSSGPRVRALHGYLTRYGYYENPELRTRLKNWQPIISQTPANLDVFDKVTQEGVLEYQKLMGLTQTGVVDHATSEVMAKPRCSHPDVDRERVDPTRKWAISNDTWSNWNLRYKFTNYTSDMAQADIQSAIATAVGRWQSISELTFTRVTGTSDIEIAFRTPTCSPASARELLCDYGALANFPSDGGNITFNDANTWNFSSLQSLAVHEIGHTLGIDHSWLPNAMMYPIVPTTVQFTVDDMQAVGSAYSRWQTLAGSIAVKDFSYSPDSSGSAWAISTTAAPDFGNLIYRRSASGVWTQDSGAASVKIAAVAPDRAWTVDKYGTVWERTATGSYFSIATPVPAVDIVYGDGKPWFVGTDKHLYFRSGTTWGVVRTNGGTTPPIVTTKVAVGRVAGYPCYGTGVIWSINSNGRISRRRSTSCENANFLWEDMPALSGGSARDIAVGADGSVWVVGGSARGTGGYGIYIWNEQDAVNEGTGIPSRRGWKLLNDGGAVGVTVQPDGLPWVINSFDTLFRRMRQ